MKQLKKLTRNQKIILSSLGYNAKEYGLVLDSPEIFTIRPRNGSNAQDVAIEYTTSTTGKVLGT